MKPIFLPPLLPCPFIPRAALVVAASSSSSSSSSWVSRGSHRYYAKKRLLQNCHSPPPSQKFFSEILKELNAVHWVRQWFFSTGPISSSPLQLFFSFFPFFPSSLERSYIYLPSSSSSSSFLSLFKGKFVLLSPLPFHSAKVDVGGKGERERLFQVQGEEEEEEEGESPALREREGGGGGRVLSLWASPSAEKPQAEKGRPAALVNIEYIQSKK